ncbi:cytochrome P450 [Xylaria grammica]|nr:cytochrome P450 [Xylaria grammica]
MFMLFFTAIVPLVSYGLFALLYKLLLHPVNFPKSVPVVGPRKQALSILRASFRQITGGIRTLLDGYGKHGQHGKPFVVYDPSGRQELLVPVEHIKWLCSQVDRKSSNHAIHQERHAAKYLKKGIELSTSRHFLGRLIRDRLNRHLHELQPLMHDELRLRIDELYGRNEEEWKEIDLYRGFEGVVTATITRVLLGLPLSRDPRISSAFQRYTLFLGLGVLYVGQLPRIFKRVVAGVINLPLGYYRNKALAALIPVVEQQVALGMDKENDVDKAQFVWHAAKISEKSIVDGLGTTCKPEVIAEWVMLLGMAGTHTTTIQATNLLLNVANCPEEWQVVELLREEAQGTLANDADWANASSFKQHVLADSVIRESLRLNPIGVKGLTREVIPSSGLKLPDGTSMPKGGWVGVPILGIHRDEKYYTNADVFEPFRFVRERSTEKAPGSCRPGKGTYFPSALA